MFDPELRQYFRSHRVDKMALQAYLDRLADRPRHIIMTVEDSDFEAKLQAAVIDRIQTADNQGEPPVS